MDGIGEEVGSAPGQCHVVSVDHVGCVTKRVLCHGSDRLAL